MSWATAWQWLRGHSDDATVLEGGKPRGLGRRCAHDAPTSRVPVTSRARCRTRSLPMHRRPGSGRLRRDPGRAGRPAPPNAVKRSCMSLHPSHGGDPQCGPRSPRPRGVAQRREIAVLRNQSSPRHELAAAQHQAREQQGSTVGAVGRRCPLLNCSTLRPCVASPTSCSQRGLR